MPDPEESHLTFIRDCFSAGAFSILSKTFELQMESVLIWTTTDKSFLTDRMGKAEVMMKIIGPLLTKPTASGFKFSPFGECYFPDDAPMIEIRVVT